LSVATRGGYVLSETKRGPGRPKTGKKKKHADMTLSISVLDVLEQFAEEAKARQEFFNKSEFVDNWLKQHPLIAERLDKPQQ
jgi:hypothetical protein